MRGRLLLPALLLVTVGFSGPGAERPKDPHFVNIVAACNPSGNARVEPSQVRIRFADNVRWRIAGRRATSFAITPKDPQRWPFRSGIAGNADAEADSGTPAGGTAAGTYSYNVVITCADGSTQVIDPDIIIGENE